MSDSDYIELQTDIEFIEGTNALLKEVSSVVDIPKDKMPDISFFTGIFVSAGQNLNGAYFLPSEMVKAHKTINNKAIDIEHEEETIVGHIYSSAYVDKGGNKLDIKELSELSVEELEKKNIDIVIGGIIYRSRFPELANEIDNKEWKLSMETYYSHYDVKIGDVVMSCKEALAMGFNAEAHLNKVVRTVRNGKEIAKGKVGKVLRNLLFSGCGVVKKPANPTSVILESGKCIDSQTTIENVDVDIIIINDELLDNNDISSNGQPTIVEEPTKKVSEKEIINEIHNYLNCKSSISEKDKRGYLLAKLYDLL